MQVKCVTRHFCLEKPDWHIKQNRTNTIKCAFVQHFLQGDILNESIIPLKKTQ